MESILNRSEIAISRFIIALSVIWSLVLLVAVGFVADEVHDSAKHQAFIRAKSTVERDMLYRKWAGHYGGVYVAVSENVQPDPLLSFMHRRDIVTTEGENLTLVSPASMTRQIYDLSNKHSNFTNRITSLDLMNPENAPDEWEAKALKALSENGADSYSDLVVHDGVEYARTIISLKTDESCLECHFDKGYKVGDVRGGISVLIPFKPFLDHEWVESIYVFITVILFWLLGLSVILFLSRQLQVQVSRVSESERQLNIAETSLHYLSHFDQKTNLPNRALFDDRLVQAIVHADRLGKKVAIAVMQVRNFNQICNTYDHAVGDSLIRRIAEVVGGCIRPDDTIARFNRESLLLLLPNIVERENVPRIIDKINYAFEEAIELEEREIFVEPSFGVTLYPEDSTDQATLVAFADTAATRAGNLEQTNFQMYSTELNDMAQEQLLLETGLRKALKGGEFKVYYQPQVDAPSGRVVGAEALIRWFHPEKGLIPPDVFIPMAENNGAILPIGEWIMREACRQAVEWQRDYDRPFKIGVNVSAKQFRDPHLVDMIEDVLKETGMPAELLEIEITEGMIMENVESAVDTLVDLKVRGVNIAIDDFGTGYSSLNQLKRFPIDRLKIDRSFVSELEDDKDDQVLVEMIIELTGKLSLAVIAEGVERKEQKEFLVARGCYSMQGYYFGKPVAAEDFRSFLDASP